MATENCNNLTNIKHIKNVLNHTSNIDWTCKEQILEYLNGLESKSKWALSMFNSGAIPPNHGQLINFGNFDQCLDVKYDNGTSGDIKGKYCIGSFLNTTWDSILNYPNSDQNVHLAACIPNDCSATDTEKFFSIMGVYLNFTENLCQTESPFQVTALMIITILLFGTIVAVVLGSTIYDLFYDKKESSKTLITKLSIRTNYNKILTPAAQNQILCLHGLKAISVLSIILIHVFLNQHHFAVTNPGFVQTWSHGFFGALALAAGFPFITFFVISGFLTGYSSMKSIEKNEEFKIIHYYLNRYLRLTPTLAVVVLFYVSFLSTIGSGPLWPSAVISYVVTPCYEKWWMVLLYIQNIWMPYSYCIIQTWFLTLDMQFFVLSPLLVYVLRKKEGIFLKLAISVITACLAYTIFVVLYYQPTDQPVNVNIEANNYFKFSLIINAPAWLIGYALSYIVQKTNRNIQISKVWVITLWLLSICILFVWIYVNAILSMGAVYKGSLLSSVFWSFYQLTWSLAIAWMIFACIFNYGGVINDFLSLSLFQVIAKLSYSMYLLHYVINFTMLAEYRYPITIDYFKTFYDYCVTLVITLSLSLLLSLFVELPSLALSEYLLKKNKKDKSSEILIIRVNLEQQPLLPKS